MPYDFCCAGRPIILRARIWQRRPMSRKVREPERAHRRRAEVRYIHLKRHKKFSIASASKPVPLPWRAPPPVGKPKSNTLSDAQVLVQRNPHARKSHAFHQTRALPNKIIRPIPSALQFLSGNHGNFGEPTGNFRGRPAIFSGATQRKTHYVTPRPAAGRTVPLRPHLSHLSLAQSQGRTPNGTAAPAAFPDTAE